jgi:hypothetical protein
LNFLTEKHDVIIRELNVNASNLKNQVDMYLSHFIRGYFDDDGNINSRGYVVSFVGGSLDFMVALENHLKTRGFEVNLTKKENHIRLYISGRKTIKEFYDDWIYHDKGLYLKRKFEAFLDQNLDAETLQNAKLKITKQAVAARKKLLLMNIEKIIAFIKHVKLLELH